eukprot:GHRQ01034866.1.p1 GENE.GHRQ01034866.1~~GHRQ01034866.1.p1  ORF type:complete len:184 (+),score=24.30 GHRQ01034866.1:84-635(+)
MGSCAASNVKNLYQAAVHTEAPYRIVLYRCSTMVAAQFIVQPAINSSAPQPQQVHSLASVAHACSDAVDGDEQRFAQAWVPGVSAGTAQNLHLQQQHNSARGSRHSAVGNGAYPTQSICKHFTSLLVQYQVSGRYTSNFGYQPHSLWRLPCHKQTATTQPTWSLAAGVFNARNVCCSCSPAGC